MSKVEPPGQQSSITIEPPRRLTWPALIVFGGYGVLLLLPALLSMLVVSTMRFSLITFALPVLALALATLLLPFGFGNSYARRLLGSLKPPTDDNPEPLLAQITFAPRLRSGFRLLFEDADDIGWLSCGDSALNFRGDSVTFSIPYSQIRAVRRQNGDWRGLFLYTRVGIQFTASGQVRTAWFAERSSLTLPGSRKAARRLFEVLKAKTS